ncbi:MAG: hypothetical protein H0X25_21215 [Acidobacteriales bacterium]|nr:hypothetical protein [Terriglobales bacterium]
MSRFCGEVLTKPILDAAAHWRDSALTDEKSVFTAGALWTREYLAALHRDFVLQPDVGDGVFLTKLREQLSQTPAAAKKLAAEVMWLLYLCPSSITAKQKRRVIQEVWSWSGEPLPDSPWLTDAVLGGIGSGGPGFNQNQWRELAFVVNFVIAFRQLPKDQARRLVGDPWEFDEWLKLIPDWEARQFRHMLLFLLFPDDFERIFGQRDRRTVLQVFGGIEARRITAMNPVELDRALRHTRRMLETEYGTTQLDYYVPPLVDRWKQIDFGRVASAITADHVRAALEEIDRDGTPPSAQSTGYDLVEAGRRYPPKLVFSIAAKAATGQEFDRNLFSGGVDSQAFKVLEKLGFEIATKDLITPLIAKFLEQAKGGTDLAVRGYLEEYRGLQVRVSFGKGNAARVSWIAFLGRKSDGAEGDLPRFPSFQREERASALLWRERNEPTRARLGRHSGRAPHRDGLVRIEV